MRHLLARLPAALPWLLLVLVVLLIAQAGVGLWRQVHAVPVQVRVFQCYANAGCAPYEPSEPGEDEEQTMTTLLELDTTPTAPAVTCRAARLGPYSVVVDVERLDRRGLPCPCCGSGLPDCTDVDPATGQNYAHEVVCNIMYAPDVCKHCAETA